MPQVPFTAFFQGPLAVYPINTGEQDLVTGSAYLGTDFLEGNYANVSNEDVKQWNSQYGTQLKGGRYRICRLSQQALQVNLPQTAGQGGVVGWAAGTFVESAVVAAQGSGATTDGTYTCSSNIPIGEATGCTAALAQVVVSGGKVISASIIQGGGPFSTNIGAPTFGLTEIAGLSGASVLAQLYQSSAYVSSFDSTALSGGSAVSLVRGITYAAPTAAQVTAGCWIIVQESGVAQINIGTAGSTTPGAQVIAVTANAGGKCNTQAPAYSGVEVGFALSVTATGTNGATYPVRLTIPGVDD